MTKNPYFHYAGLWIAVSALNLKAGDVKWATIYFIFGIFMIVIGIMEEKP